MAARRLPLWVWALPLASAVAAVLAWTVWCHTERGTWLGGVLILATGVLVLAFAHESLPERRGFGGWLGRWALALLAASGGDSRRVPRRWARLLPPVPALLAVAGALALAGGAQATTVSVVVVPPFPLERYAEQGAVGLMPRATGDGQPRGRAGRTRPRQDEEVAARRRPGRRAADRAGLAARGGDDLRLAAAAGTHRNDTRYPGGHRGRRLPRHPRVAVDAHPGSHLDRGHRPDRGRARRDEDPRIGSTAGTPADLRELDRTLRRQARARNPAIAILAFSAIALAVLALLVRSPAVARAGVLASPLALAVSIALAGGGLTWPAVLLIALALLTVSLSVAGGALLHRRTLAVAFTALVAAYLVVLVAKPTWPALAAIGPTPGEGGRFYGSTNLTTSIVVAATLFAGATFGLRGLVPVAVLSLVTVGWSKAGADGGGLVVVAAGCAVLGMRLATGRLTIRAVAVAGALAVVLGLALVGLDAATGGSSHVTRRVGDGPGALLGELGNRLHISAERARDVVASRARLRDRDRRPRHSRHPPAEIRSR